MEDQKRRKWIERGRGEGGKKGVRGEWRKRKIRATAKVKEVGAVREVRASRIERGARAGGGSLVEIDMVLSS